MSNIWNAHSVDEFLEKIADGDTVLFGHLKTALRRPLLLEESHLHIIDTIPDNAPSWLIGKWDQAQEWHQWTHTLRLEGQVSHIKDWIKAAMVNDADWLKNTDDKGRVEKLMRIATLDDATRKADQAMRQNRQNFIDQGEAEGAIKVIKSWDAEGYTLVQILTAQGLNREGGMMGHCIGDGAYDEHIAKGDRIFYSLRDRKNKAHATLEVNSKTNTLLQCKGKENLPPISKYMPFIQDFVQEQQYKLHERPSHIGLIEQDSHYYDICNLPEDFYYDGSLNLDKSYIKQLPKGLACHSLILTGSNIIELPEGLICTKHLIFTNTNIIKLPNDITVSGFIRILDGTAYDSVKEARDALKALQVQRKTAELSL